jgi:hypothetical protein
LTTDACFVDYLATKHAMADASRVVVVTDGDRMQTRDLLTEAWRHS